jgi:hypothetical protein
MKTVPIKRASTLFLKGAILLIGALVLAFCVFAFPQLWIEGTAELSDHAHVLYPGLIGFYLTAVPFFFALYQAFKLLQYIDANNAFSSSSISALRNIKFCAIAMSVLYWTGMPLVFVFADLDDAPGAVIIGAALACSPLIVATFAAVLQKLVQNAIDIKAENDLTI